MADGPAWRRDSTSHHHETLLNPKLYQSEQQRCSASLMSVMRAANLCPSSDTRQEDHPELSVLPVFRTLRVLRVVSLLRVVNRVTSLASSRTFSSLPANFLQGFLKLRRWNFSVHSVRANSLALTLTRLRRQSVLSTRNRGAAISEIFLA
jgi:hypothetical protein